MSESKSNAIKGYKHNLDSNTIPNQYVSETEKSKESWYVATINGIIDKGTSMNNKATLKASIDASKGEIDTATLVAISLPLNNEKPLPKNSITSYINSIDFITPIKERYLGEFARSITPFTAAVINDNPEERMNGELYDEVRKYFEQLLINKINEFNAKQEQGVDIGMESKELPNVEEFVEEFTSKWKDANAITAQSLLDLMKQKTEDSLLYYEAYFNWFATDCAFTYRTIDSNGEFVKEVVSPLEYYRIPGRTNYVCEDEMGFRKYKMSINEVFSTLDDRLTDKDKLYIRERLDKYDDAGTLEINLSDISAINSTRFLDDDLVTWTKGRQKRTGGDKYFLFDQSMMVDVFHIFIKSKAKYGELMYQNQLGELGLTEVSESYKLDKQNGDISIEWKWRDIILDGYRIGDDDICAVYTKLQPIPIQGYDKNGNNPKAPYNGVTGLFRNYGLKPIPIRAMPHLALYRLITRQIISTLRKLKIDWIVMPEELVQDSRHMNRVDRLMSAKDDNVLFIKGSEADANMLQAIRNIGNSGNVAEVIKSSMEFRQSIKDDAWEVCNMNQERYGNVDSRGGKGVQEEAIRRVSLGSIPMLEIFNHFRCKDYNLDLEYIKVAWNDGVSGVAISDGEGNLIRVNISTEFMQYSDIGIWVVWSANEQMKLEAHKNFLAQAGAQNQDFVIASEAISATSSSKLRDFIKKYQEHKEKLQAIEADKARKHEADLAEKANQALVDARAHEINKIDVTKKWDMAIKNMTEWSQNNPDATVEQYNEQFTNQLKQMEVLAKIEDNKVKNSLKARDLELKKEKIDADKHIAKINKN